MDNEMIERARSVDLIGLIEKDLGQDGKRSGSSVMFRCPFHEDHNPSLSVRNDYWKCFGCGKGGSSIDWVKEFRKVSFVQAVQDLNGSRFVASSGRAPAARNEPWEKIDQPPGDKWQARALQLIERAQNCLWSEEGIFHETDWRETNPETGEMITLRMAPIDYLFSRGLHEDTLRFWKIGYIPKQIRDKAASWGLEKDVILYQGILIPCIVNNLVWYLKIRVPLPVDGKKYPQVTGSKAALYLAPTVEWQDTVVFTEGEFDALLLWQEAGDLAGVVTLGGCRNPLNVLNWGLYIMKTENRMIAYDVDKEGEEGADGLAWLGNSRRVKVPQLRTHDKDITDFWRRGGDLHAWLQGELEVTRNLFPDQCMKQVKV